MGRAARHGAEGQFAVTVMKSGNAPRIAHSSSKGKSSSWVISPQYFTLFWANWGEITPILAPLFRRGVARSKGYRFRSTSLDCSNGAGLCCKGGQPAILPSHPETGEFTRGLATEMLRAGENRQGACRALSHGRDEAPIRTPSPGLRGEEDSE